MSMVDPLHDGRRIAVLDSLSILGTAREAAYDDIALLAATSCGSDTAAVNFVDREQHWTKAIVGACDGQGTTVFADLSLCAATVRSPGGSLIVPDMLAEPRWRSHPFVTAGPLLRFYAGASIVVDGAAVGVVCVFGDQPRPVGEREQSALQALARHTARHLELRRMSLTDPLTGLPNRTLLLDRLEHALAQRRPEDDHVGIVFCDIDDFKAINDRHGHDIGDRLLCDVAGHLRAAVRDGDTVARLAGDEFVLVCPGVDGECELGRIVGRVQGGSLRFARAAARLQMSVGAVLAGEHEPAQAVLRRADAAMYAAKAGRIERRTPQTA
jgi:diguanylate cyclase (GGDEF)-like protein